ncbi:MAG: primosomal protein N' [Pseudomonadota bacterium]|nr:primosomal protein N' [Pseudomonadota bacterium]
MTDARPLIRVALPVPMFQLFDYQLPDETHQLPDVGCRVRVPFGRQKLIGIVIGQGDVADVAPHKLRAAFEILDQAPAIGSDLLPLLVWSAQYYHFPIGEVLLMALPTLLRQGRPLDILNHYWRVVDPLPPTHFKTGSAQKLAFDILNLHDQRGAPESVLQLMGVNRSQLKQLEKRGLAVEFVQPYQASPDPVELAELPLTPSKEQAVAISQIQQCLGRYQGILLEGLTGSGKTEVYLQAMQPVLERGQQVLVLVPEIGLTPQTIGRFQARFHAHVVMLHSGMTDVQRLNAWQMAQNGAAHIVIGTRSAIFTPLPRLGLVVVDEEHDLSYKQQDSFRYHARDLALRRGQLSQAPVVLGSATPSLESLELAQQNKLLHLKLTERASGAALANMKLIDLRGQSRENGLSKPLIQAIRERLDAQDQVLIFLNRRGYAPVLLCDACGWQADCPRCDAHLTVHQSPRAHLHCHHCGYHSQLPPLCPTCKSPNLLPTGTGTARLEETLRTHFSEISILRVDRDTTQRVGSWEAIYQRANTEGAAILLGTQMLAKGHHFPHVTLVAILDADAGFLSSDFRAPERTAQLIMQVAGRAGRGHKLGQVIIQTWQPDNPLLQTLIQHGYDRFATTTLQERQLARLPPYRYAALIRAESRDRALTQQFLTEALQCLQAEDTDQSLEVWGPIPAPMERKAGIFRGHGLILCSNRKQLHHQIERWWPQVWQMPQRRHVRVSLDIDPQELS